MMHGQKNIKSKPCK